MKLGSELLHGANKCYRACGRKFSVVRYGVVDVEGDHGYNTPKQASGYNSTNKDYCTTFGIFESHYKILKCKERVFMRVDDIKNVLIVGSGTMVSRSDFNARFTIVMWCCTI